MNARLLTVLCSVFFALGTIVFNLTSGKQIERVIFGYFAVIFTSPTPSPSAISTSSPSAISTSSPSETPTSSPSETPTSSPSETPTSSPSAISTSSPSPIPTSSPSPIPTSSSSPIPTSSSSPILNSNNCAGGFDMPIPNTWYGPFDNRFSLMWDQQNIYADDLQRRIYSPYNYPNHPLYPSYPHANFIRGTWNRLSGSPFNVCIEPSSGKVFGQYNS